MAPTSFNDLSLELVARIIDFAVQSDIPFYPQHIIELAGELRSLRSHDEAHPMERKDPRPQKPGYAYVKRGQLRERAKIGDDACAVTPTTALINAALPSQRPHLRDWIMINGTCQRVRGVGRRCFFTQKVLVFTLESLWDFCAGKAVGISGQSQAIAVSCARVAIVHFRPKAVDFQRIPRVRRELPRLQRLGIYSSRESTPLFEKSELSKTPTWNKLPERLEASLRSIGLDMDLVEVGFLYERGEDGRQQQIALLTESDYQHFDACATLVEKTRAASKAVSPCQVKG